MEIFIIIIFVLIFIVLIISTIKDKRTPEQVQKDELLAEQKAKEREQERRKKQEIFNNDRNAIKQRKQMAKTIKTVKILNNYTDSRKDLKSTFLRGAIGNTLAGPVGLVAGTLSGKNKNKNKTVFLIEYEDGHVETKEVDNNSDEFQYLYNKLK